MKILPVSSKNRNYPAGYKISYLISYITSSASLNLHMIACDSTRAEQKWIRVYNQKNEDLDAVFPVKKK